MQLNGKDVKMSGEGYIGETFYFTTHGEINTTKTIELAKKRADELKIKKIIIASETGLSALEAIKVFDANDVIVVSSAAGTIVENTIIGNLRIGITDKEIYNELVNRGVKVIRGTDPFWGLGAHSDLTDTGKLGMMFYKVICGGIHVCMTAILEATDQGLLESGEESIALAGSWVGLDTSIVAKACNTVNFFKEFEVLELICKPRNARYSWPINQEDWRGDFEKYRRFTL
jgi:hypothetical protein